MLDLSKCPPLASLPRASVLFRGLGKSGSQLCSHVHVINHIGEVYMHGLLPYASSLRLEEGLDA